MTDGREQDAKSEKKNSPKARARKGTFRGQGVAKVKLHPWRAPDPNETWTIHLRPKPGSFSPVPAEDTAELDE